MRMRFSSCRRSCCARLRGPDWTFSPATLRRRVRRKQQRSDELNADASDQSGNSQNAMHIGQKLRADLGKAGYTDISVVPSPLSCTPRISQGNPVMMVISPDSVTSITEQNARAEFGKQRQPLRRGEWREPPRQVRRCRAQRPPSRDVRQPNPATTAAAVAAGTFA